MLGMSSADHYFTSVTPDAIYGPITGGKDPPVQQGIALTRKK